MSENIADEDAAEAEGFRSRLRELIEQTTRGNLLAYSRLARVSEGALRKYVKGAAEPGRDILVRLAAGAQSNVRWLATGEGPRGEGIGVEQEWAQDIQPVPLYEAELSAGTGRAPWAEGEPPDVLRLPKAVVRDLFRARGFVVAVRVAGDSMEPTIRDGTIALLDPKVTRIDRDGAIYAVRSEDVLLIKRAFLIPGVGIRLSGDNPNTPDLELQLADAERLAVLGRICGVLNRT